MSLPIRASLASYTQMGLGEERQTSPAPEVHLSLVLSNESCATSRVFTGQWNGETAVCSEKVFVGYVSSSLVAYHEAQEDGLHLSHVLNGHLVVGIHNRRKAVRVLRFVKNSIEVRILRKFWEDFFSRQPDGVVIQYFCGDGSHVVEEALAQCEHRPRIVLVGIDSEGAPAHPASYYYRSTPLGFIRGGTRRYDVVLDTAGEERGLPRLNRDMFTAALANPFLEFSHLGEGQRGLVFSPEVIQTASMHREIGFLDVSQFRFVLPNQEDSDHILMHRTERLQAVSQRIREQREFRPAMFGRIFEIALTILKISGYIGLIAGKTRAVCPTFREMLGTSLLAPYSATMKTTLTCKSCYGTSLASIMYRGGVDASGRLPDGRFPSVIYPEKIYPDGYFSDLQLGVLLQYIVQGEDRGHYPYGHFINGDFPYARYFSGNLIVCNSEPLPLDDEVGRILQGRFVPFVYPQYLLVDGTYIDGSQPFGDFSNPGRTACYEEMFPYERFFRGDFIRERYDNFKLPDNDPLSAHFNGKELPAFYPGGIRPDGEFPSVDFPYPYGIFRNNSFPYQEFFFGKFDYETRFLDNFRHNDPWNSPHATMSISEVGHWKIWNTSTVNFAAQITQETSLVFSNIGKVHTMLPSTQLRATVYEDQAIAYLWSIYWSMYGVCQVALAGTDAYKYRRLRALVLGFASSAYAMNMVDLLGHCITTHSKEGFVDMALHSALAVYSSASLLYQTARFAAPWVRYQTFRLGRAMSGVKQHKRIGAIAKVDQHFHRETRHGNITATLVGLLAVTYWEHFCSVGYVSSERSSEYRIHSAIQIIFVCCVAVLLYGMMACNLIVR